MREYQILADAGCDLTPAWAESLGVQVIPMEVTFEGEPTQMTDEIDLPSFYEKLSTGKNVTTAAVNMERLEEAFRKVLDGGRDVLYLGFSSGLSSTCHNGQVVAEDLNNQLAAAGQPGKVLAVDSLAASLGYGLLVYYASEKQKAGATLEETAAYVEDIRLRLCHWFTVDDLFFLRRGGRISATTAVVGSMLSIKPVMHVDNEGHLIAMGKVRGRRKSVEELVNRMAGLIDHPEGQTVYICQGHCMEDANYLSSLIKARWPEVREVRIGYTGPAIGAHSGPGTLAVFFLGTQR